MNNKYNNVLRDTNVHKERCLADRKIEVMLGEKSIRFGLSPSLVDQYQVQEGPSSLGISFTQTAYF